VLLVAVAIYVACKPKLGSEDRHPRMQRPWFDLIFGLGLGFYDGFFGPGTGTFWAMSYVLVLGFNLTRATAYTKVMNFASNVSSLAFFLAGGKIHLLMGLTMGVGQLIGARTGSRMVLTRGTRLIRPVFLTVVIILTLKLLYDSYRA
jgi:uncharacterized membrane protein YfcA